MSLLLRPSFTYLALAVTSVAACTKDPLVPPTAVVHTVEVTAPDDSLLLDATVRLEVKALDVHGKIVRGRPTTWSTSDTATILVAPTGDIKVVGVGSTTISAKVDDVIGTVNIAAFAISFVGIEAGSDHSCGLTTTGDVYCWGSNRDGRLGTGTADTASQYFPQRVAGTTKFQNISVGGPGACGITEDGSGYCWGYNPEGQLGTGSTENELEPTRIAGGYAFSTISLGSDHSCGLTTDGSAFCWGNNRYGQLGNGNRQTSLVPVPVMSAESFSAITAGYLYTCALTTSGSSACWGNDSGGNLGHDTTYASLVPVPIVPDPGLTTLSAGPDRTCGLDMNGATYCWGFKRFWHAGWQSSVPTGEAPNIPFTTVAEGYSHACGLTAQGDAYCWGANDSGQLGRGVFGDQNVNYRAEIVMGGHKFRSIDAGGDHTCGATMGGEALCWGYDRNALGNSSIPGDRTAVPVPVSGGHTFVQVATGYGGTCAIDASGAAFCWGWGTFGNPAYSPPQSSPVPVAGGITFQYLGYGGFNTMCGLSTTGEAYCWGSGLLGALGNGQQDSNSPVPVAVSGGHTFSSLSVGRFRSCALTPSGTAWCWGNNDSGANGNGTTQPSTVPVPVSGGLSFREIAVGSSHTCGITTAGSTMCWGLNRSGQLGNGVTTDSPLPVAVVTTERFGQIGAGYRSTCGLTSSNGLFCWPKDATGHPVRLPTNLAWGVFSMGFEKICGITTIGIAYCWDLYDGEPIRVLAPVPFSSISTGASHFCALGGTNTAYCWGNNWNGRLGTDHGINSTVPDATQVLGQMPLDRTLSAR